jgi:hypothetical protein
MEGKKTAREKLLARGDVLAHLLREMPKPVQVWKGFIGEAWTNEEVRGIVQGHLRDRRERLAGLIRGAQEEGEGEIGAGNDADLSASLLMALYDGLLFQWVIDPEAFRIEDYTRAMNALIGVKNEGDGKN